MSIDAPGQWVRSWAVGVRKGAGPQGSLLSLSIRRIASQPTLAGELGVAARGVEESAQSVGAFLAERRLLADRRKSWHVQGAVASEAQAHEHTSDFDFSRPCEDSLGKACWKAEGWKARRLERVPSAPVLQCFSAPAPPPCSVALCPGGPVRVPCNRLVTRDFVTLHHDLRQIQVCLSHTHCRVQRPPRQNSRAPRLFESRLLVDPGPRSSPTPAPLGRTPLSWYSRTALTKPTKL